ncbi:hypothetical protein [Actinomadura sp. NEAU-AAG7]|uniref:hypothetical protein n=1 Tax=Actinomadura sp. NEAU-AAG7 TaxID=2839640 RepID=UPI001BE4074E|nr:hypothetical protein [Actinomadura sp. NEAU-AAG7]MBT2210080.1 hypothetical protein [Actinomadura sp. NEAU-AAG7]
MAVPPKALKLASALLGYASRMAVLAHGHCAEHQIWTGPDLPGAHPEGWHPLTSDEHRLWRALTSARGHDRRTSADVRGGTRKDRGLR